MTNSQIIYQAAQAHGFTEEQLSQLLEAYKGDLPFHTFQDWARRGYQVKAGEKAMFTADLWKYTDKPGKAARETAEENGEEVPETSGHYYKKLSYLFAFSQVEKAAPAPALDVLLSRFQDVPGLTLTVKGAQTASPVVWLSGDTEPHKAAILANGGHWSNKKQAYFFKPAAATDSEPTPEPTPEPAPVPALDPFAAPAGWKKCKVSAIRREPGDAAPKLYTMDGYTDGIYTYYATNGNPKTWFVLHPGYGLSITSARSRQAAQDYTRENAARIASAIARIAKDETMQNYAAMISQAEHTR